MSGVDAPSDPPHASADTRMVLRNTAYLGIAEVLSLPLSVLLNGMIGRFLGPLDLGHIYLATTITSLTFLAVAWGHGGSLPAAVVRDKPSAGALLGTSIAWRASAAVFAYVVVASVCHALGFSSRQQWAIGLVFLSVTLTNIVGACQDVIRGFERTDIAAYARVGLQLVTASLVIPVLLLGGRLRLTLLIQAAATLVVLFPMLRALPAIGVGKMHWDRERFKALMIGGTPFVFFSLVIVIQPSIDAFYLAKFCPEEVVGWYAVEQKLIGFLIVPSTALIGALYPTLCRLWTTDNAGFRRTTRGAISTVGLVVVPVAIGCAIYPDIGVSIFGRDAFRPAEGTLTVASIYLFLVYFSMPIGTALVAAGRQKAWTTLQIVCVINSAVLDPFLVQHFQASQGNGGVGLATASSISEFVMVSVGLMLMPPGVLNGTLGKTLVFAAVSGGAMAGTALAMRGFVPSLVGAPIAAIVYAVALSVTGAVTADQRASLVGAVRRKLSRGKSA